MNIVYNIQKLPLSNILRSQLPVFPMEELIRTPVIFGLDCDWPRYVVSTLVRDHIYNRVRIIGVG
jgi:hypothetical protein